MQHPAHFRIGGGGRRSVNPPPLYSRYIRDDLQTGQRKGGAVRKVDPHASCFACAMLCKRVLLKRLQNEMSGQPDRERDALSHV
eukprot:9089914-Pyramimonas_sp.AAC.1